MVRPRLLATILGLMLVGCQSGSTSDSTSGKAAPAASSQPTTVPAGQSTAAPIVPPPSGKVFAYVDGGELRWADLHTPLVEAGGGQVLAELVLDQRLARRLGDHGLKITSEQLETERHLLLASLDPNPDQAHRLLAELRQRRGLGDVRFQQLLHRNAAMRLLVQDQVQVSETAVRQEFELEYGPQYELRLIVVDSLQKAASIARRAREGESFVDLAIAQSTDSSRVQGGLLSPMSPADVTYPAGIRQAVSKLKVAQVSDPIALDRGYAILRLERKIDGKSVKFDDVEKTLQEQVRRRVERMLMQRLARTLLAEAQVVIFDPALQKSWEQQKRNLSQQD